MTTLREILDGRKNDERPKEYGPRKGRPWGRHHRRLFREANALADPGEYYGQQLHYKNAAAREKYRVGLAAIMATGATGEALQFAVEDLQRHHCKTVNIFYAYNNRVRRQLRSELAREERNEAKYDSGHAPRSPEDSA
jgi:hypothetical protein